MTRREVVLETLVYPLFNHVMRLLAGIIFYSNCCHVYGYRFILLNSTIKEYCFKPYCLLGCCAMYSGKKFTEVLEAAHFFETVLHFYQTTGCCMAEGRNNLHSHCYVDLRYYRFIACS
jgi:hypothetical protein